MVSLKYVVYDDYRVRGIFNTEADAEEFVLAIAEEKAYEEYVDAIYYSDHLTNENYFCYNQALADLEDINIYDVALGQWFHTERQTFYSALLMNAIEDDALRIDEAWCYED